MSNMMTDFMNPASPLLGVGMAAHYTVAPDVFAFRLLDTAKRHARFLEDIFPEIGHRKMLESIAVACKFPNWHAFQSLLKNVRCQVFGAGMHRRERSYGATG